MRTTGYARGTAQRKPSMHTNPIERFLRAYILGVDSTAMNGPIYRRVALQLRRGRLVAHAHGALPVHAICHGTSWPLPTRACAAMAG